MASEVTDAEGALPGFASGLRLQRWLADTLVLLAVATACSADTPADGVALLPGPGPAGTVTVDFRSLWRESAGSLARATSSQTPGQALDFGERILLRPGGVAWDSELGMLVGDNGGKVIYRFPHDADMQVIGGPGAGPGEFTSLQLVGVTRASHIVVYSPMQQQVTLLDSLGKFVSARRIGRPDWGSLYVRALAEDGSVVLVQLDAPGGVVPRGTTEDSGSVEIVSLDSRTTSLGRFSVRDRVRRIGASGTEHRGSPPFGREILVAMHDDLIAVAENKAPTIRIYDRTGALLRTLWIGFRPGAVGKAARDVYRRRIEPFLQVAEEEWTILSGDDVFPARFPPFRTLTFDDQGRLFAFTWPPAPERPSEGFMLDVSGNPLAMVHVPGGIEPTLIRGQRGLGWWLDTLDVARPVVFSLEPGPPAP